MNNTTIPQVQKLKYLRIIIIIMGIIKLHSREMHEINICKCKISKDQLGMGHKALRTIYVGGILPLLLYGAPVWSRAMKKEK